MLNFTFHNPTKILFGKGQIAAIAQEIPQGQRVLMTYGGGSIKQNGVYDQVMAALAGRAVIEFAGIEPNPTYETLMNAVQIVREHHIDFLLAVGGGSVVDGTKFIAAAAPFQGEPWDILAKRAPIRSALPLGAVLTLPATGSEMNGGSVVTRRATQDKLAFIHPLVYPRFSVLDPIVTFTLPPRQIGNGVVDAYTHIMEQYLTYPVNSPVQDRFAEGLLLTLIEEGPKALATPENYDVRANIMWCATLALNGLIGAGVPGDWATHMIGHEITALHGLDHAQTLAIILPSVMAAKRDQKRAKLLQYAERVWSLSTGGEDERIDAAIAKTREFFARMGVGTYLRDYGIAADTVPALLAQLERHRMTALGEHQDINLTASRRILELSVAA
ncbi:MAG: alcohol dehydrogenase [Candidatus Contendobacter sp.]|nr:alcohol dehydrogenase [Candidatus Contendobacter sp.]